MPMNEGLLMMTMLIWGVRLMIAILCEDCDYDRSSLLEDCDYGHNPFINW